MLLCCYRDNNPHRQYILTCSGNILLWIAQRYLLWSYTTWVCLDYVMTQTRLHTWRSNLHDLCTQQFSGWSFKKTHNMTQYKYMPPWDYIIKWVTHVYIYQSVCDIQLHIWDGDVNADLILVQHVIILINQSINQSIFIWLAACCTCVLSYTLILQLVLNG